MPTQFLDENGAFSRQRPREHTAADGPSQHHHHRNGSGAPSPLQDAVDLTGDDMDDFTLVDARGPHVAQDPDEQVCIGLVNAVVLAMFGLPESFISAPPAKLSEHNAHPKWDASEWPSGSGFYLEPGYRPVELIARGGGAPGASSVDKSEIQVHEVVPPMDVRQQLEGLGRPVPKGPQLKSSSFGSLAEKYKRGLHALMVRRMVRISARCRIVTPNSGQNFLHAIELLCFTARRDVEKVSNYLYCENVHLEYPPNYDPAHFTGRPPCEMVNRHIPAHAPSYSRYTLQSHGTVMHTKEATEQEKKRQVDAVYASLRDGEDLEMVEASDRIATPLLPHQKQALAFLLDREKVRSFAKAGKGEIVSLWKPVRRADKITSYEHVVTQGEQKRAPLICRGAILADDMGLGKTLAAIALIATTASDALRFQESGEGDEGGGSTSNDAGGTPRLESGAYDDDDGDDGDVTIEDFTINVHGAPPPKRPRPGKPKKKGKRQERREAVEEARRADIVTRSRATLVVLPLTLVSAWEGQLDEHWSDEDRPSVCIYHGPGRLTDAAAIADHDIVMTTYATLASEYAQSIADEEGEAVGEGGSGATSGAVSDADDAFLVDAKAGRGKGGATGKKRKTGEERTKSAIQQIEWFRIVLDEAHTIKEARTLQSRAVCHLMASRRVCLTGTPVQNRIDDLYALIRFLRLEPFDDRGVWNQFCGSREKSASLRGVRKANGDKNVEPLDGMALARVQTIMKFLTLRRTKETQLASGEAILSLPPKYSRILTLKFDDKERATYDEMRIRYKDDFEQMKASDTLKHNYATILHEISNLRMTCDHMGMVDASKDAKRKRDLEDDPAAAIIHDGLSRDRAIGLFELLCSSDRARCRLCEYDLSAFAEGERAGKSPVLTRCLHLFCSDCLRAHIGEQQYGNPKAEDRFGCPECGVAVSPLLEMRELLLGDVQGEQGQRVLSEETFGCDRGVETERRPDYSSKIAALVLELEAFSRCNAASLLFDDGAPALDQVASTAEQGMAEPVLMMASTDSARPAPIKSVIFSQWTKMLDRVAVAVHRAGIKAAYLDGRMRRQERSENLDKFKSEAGVEVLLVSLKAGGIGLNLVSACRAYLMEPYWNPAIENQGLDRVHRMGQTRPVITTKFIMANSIEENMLELQKRKLRLAESVGEKRNAEQQREELNLLFSARDDEDQ